MKEEDKVAAGCLILICMVSVLALVAVLAGIIFGMQVGIITGGVELIMLIVWLMHGVATRGQR